MHLVNCHRNRDFISGPAAAYLSTTWDSGSENGLKSMLFAFGAIAIGYMAKSMLPEARANDSEPDYSNIQGDETIKRSRHLPKDSLAYRELSKHIDSKIIDSVWIQPNSPKVDSIEGALAITHSETSIGFATGKYDPYSELGAKLIAHEFGHVMQYRRLFGFKVRYAINHMRYGYHLNPLEVEARTFANTVFP